MPLKVSTTMRKISRIDSNKTLIAINGQWITVSLLLIFHLFPSLSFSLHKFYLHLYK